MRGLLGEAYYEQVKEGPLVSRGMVEQKLAEEMKKVKLVEES